MHASARWCCAARARQVASVVGKLTNGLHVLCNLMRCLLCIRLRRMGVLSLSQVACCTCRTLLKHLMMHDLVRWCRRCRWAWINTSYAKKSTAPQQRAEVQTYTVPRGSSATGVTRAVFFMLCPAIDIMHPGPTRAACRAYSCVAASASTRKFVACILACGRADRRGRQAPFQLATWLPTKRTVCEWGKGSM